MKQIFYICFFLLPIGLFGQTNYSSLVSVNKNKKIELNPYTSKGDVLPDFSFCGYMGGGIPLPKIKNVLELSPVEGNTDDTERIQTALNHVGNLPLNKDGLRGAVLLKKGTYRIANTLKINNSGVVLRGEGKEKGGTLLIGTTPKQYTLISIGNNSGFTVNNKSRTKIADKYVPSGTRVFTLENIYQFSVGDNVIVERASTKEWISFIGMDKIAAGWLPINDFSPKNIERLKAEGRFDESQKKYNSTIQWEAGSKNLKFERKIKAISGSKITVDIPITNAIQSEYGGAEVYKYTYSNRISNVGIENLAGESLYDSTVTANLPYLKGYYADENHAWTFVSFNTCENVWAIDLRCSYFSMGFNVGSSCRYSTVKNCEVVDPVSQITGGRRYAYAFNGQMGLVIESYSRNFRHDFVLGASVAGPNAFVNSKAELSHAASEPHHRWATGCLWDNCEVSGQQGYISLSNRGNYGSGHGWAGAQMILWNCRTPLAVIMAPPTAMNFSIGTTTMKTNWSDNATLTYLVDRLNKISGNNFIYKDGLPAVGDGFIESQNKFVSPQSLYEAQLVSRLGGKK